MRADAAFDTDAKYAGHHRVPHHLMGVAVANDASVLEQGERMAVAQRQPQIVDHQQRDAAMTPAVVGDLVEHAQLMVDVQRAGGLVE